MRGPVGTPFFPASQWFFTNEGCGVNHWVTLRNFLRTVRLLVALDANVPFVDLSCPVDGGVFLGWLDLSLRPATFVPIALSHILGRPVVNLGPHLYFFTESADVTIVLPRDFDEAFANFRNGQADLSGLHRSEVCLADGTDREAAVVSIWRTIPPSNDEKLEVPPDVLLGIVTGRYIYAELREPRVNFTPDNAFARTWRDLMPSPIIPFDLHAAP